MRKNFLVRFFLFFIAKLSSFEGKKWKLCEDEWMRQIKQTKILLFSDLRNVHAELFIRKTYCDKLANVTWREKNLWKNFRFKLIKWEKVRTTKITTSKTKKNSENSVDDQNVESVHLFSIKVIRTSKFKKIRTSKVTYLWRFAFLT